MKKLIYSLWVLSFASTGCLTLTTAWKSNNSNEKIPASKIDPPNFPVTKIGKPNPWNAIDLRNFVVPNHHLNIQNHQATDPSQADLNIDFYVNYTNYDIINYLLQALDDKYQQFNHHYFKGEDLYFEDKLSFDNYKYSFDIIDTDTEEPWNIPIAVGNSQTNGYSSYNLALENKETNTSFDFSLNLADFDIVDYSGVNSLHVKANLPNMDMTSDSLYGNQAKYFNTHTNTGQDQTALDFNQMIQSENGYNIGKFNNANATSFFLQPFAYSFKYNDYIDWSSFDDSYVTYSDTENNINLNNLATSNILNMQNGFDTPAYEVNMDYVDEGEHLTWDWDISDPNWNYNDNYTDRSSSLYYTPGGLTISQNTAVLAYLNEDKTKLYLDNQAMVGADYMPSDYHFHFQTYGTGLTTSYNNAVFNNSPYSLDEGGFDAGQNVLNRLKDLNQLPLNLPITENDIKNLLVQAELKTKLKGNNPNILTELQWYHISFSLASGQTTMIYG